MVFFTGIRRNWDKIELYIISLWLSFLLIIFITADIPIYLGRDWKFIGFNTIVRQNLIPLFALLLLILGMIFYARFSYKLGGSDQIPFEIKKIENINFEHLTFLTTYIIPLICFDLSNIRYVVVLMFLLIIIGAIYVKTDMFYVNPSLALLGYHIYKANGSFINDDKENIILIARERLQICDKVVYKKLDNRIYFVKRIR